MDNQQETKFVNIRVDVTKLGSSETRRGAPTLFTIGSTLPLAGLQLVEIIALQGVAFGK